jgi:hypothetical protein
MLKRIFIILISIIIIYPAISTLHASASGYAGIDVIQSIGRTYFGGALGYISNSAGFAVGYYYSPAPQNGTAGSYIPIYSISKSKSIDIGIGLDLRSIFARSGGVNKSSPSRYAYELLLNYHPIAFLSIGARYFWSTGGYLPKGLSLSVGLQTPNF